MSHRLAVLVASPAHSSIRGPLSYRSELPLAPGTLVRVPLGRREVLGLVWDAAVDDDAGRLAMEDKPVGAVLEGIAPLAPTWRQLVTFSANYYQRSLGEVALAALPPQLRDLTGVQLFHSVRCLSGGSTPITAPTSPTGNGWREPAWMRRFSPASWPRLANPKNLMQAIIFAAGCPNSAHPNTPNRWWIMCLRGKDAWKRIRKS